MTISRRALLKAAGAGMLAYPGAIISTALGSETKAPPSDRVTLGYIGVGGRGGSLINGFRRIKEVEHLGVSDPFRSRRERWGKQLNCKAYPDFRKLLDRKDIDGVVVATPDHWHVPIAIAAARAGKDMYVEKPLGISVAHNQAARAAIKKHKVMFQYGTQQRSIRHCHHGCELVRNGRIGKLHTIEVVAPNGSKGGSTVEIPVPEDLDYNMWLGPAPKAPYTKDRCTRGGAWFVYDYAIGFIAGWGAHPLDILDWGFDSHLAGNIEVKGTGVVPSEGLYNTVINWDLTYKFAGGINMTLKPGGDSTKFIGDKGWVRISRGSYDAEPKSLLKEQITSGVRLQRSPGHDRNFVFSIKTRKEPVSGIDSAVRSDILSHLGDIAVRTQRTIRWDPTKEVILGDKDASAMLSRELRAPWTL